MMRRLSDEQVREFVANGVLVLKSDPDNPDLHRKIYDKMAWSIGHEFNMGNNVLPRVPELQRILDCPTVHGALVSILGDDYLLHPHRYMHPSEPVGANGSLLAGAGQNNAVMGEGSKSSPVFHQDSQCPLSRARYHVPRFAMLLYFPQDTPPEKGPTRFIPGTHLHFRAHDRYLDHAILPDFIEAGSCVVTAFDICHAGAPNLTDEARYMFKFVFLRTSAPRQPAWDCRSDAWRRPVNCLAPYDIPNAWTAIWNWMRGAPRFDGVVASENAPDGVELSADVASLQKLSRLGAAAAPHIPQLLSILNLDNEDEALRLSAIYALAAIGEAAVEPLCAHLQAAGGNGREIAPTYERAPNGRLVAQLNHRNERRWQESATVYEDAAYALGAIGAPAVPSLTRLVGDDDAWVRMNAAFALGECGIAARGSVRALAKLLDDPSHRVVRCALDAITAVGAGFEDVFDEIATLLRERRATWLEPIRREWTGNDQVRFNAICALFNSDLDGDAFEGVLGEALNDENGYVAALAVERLLRCKTASALEPAIRFLSAHRFDDTLKAVVKAF